MTRTYIGEYRCQWCKRNFTDEQFPHLSLRIELGSGLATPHTRFPGWRVAKLIPQDCYHFCNGDCLGKWADTFIAEESDAV